MIPPSLVEQAYEAALDPGRWLDYLHRLRDAFRVTFVHLFSEELRDRRAGLSIETGLDPAAKAEYYQHYFFLDPGWIAKRRLPAGVATASNQLMPDRTYERREYYADFARRYGFFYQMGCTIERSRHSAAFLGMVRARRLGGYDPQDLRRMEVLVPHLRQALEIGRRLGLLEAQRDTLLELAQRLRLGVILLGERGAVLFANDAARRMAQDTPLLRLGGAGLHAAAPAQEDRLQALVGEALRTGSGEGIHPGGTLVLGAPGSAAALDLRVAPLAATRSALRFGAQIPRAIVFLNEAGHPPRVSRPELMDLFGLTAAEAEIAALLAEGRTPQDIARDTARSLHTVRTQLRAAMRKTGVGHQADLVRLVLTTPAALVARPDEDGSAALPDA